MQTGYTSNIESETLENSNFRKVLFTAPESQLVLMSLKPSEEIGLEAHDHGDQFFRIEAGTGEAIIDGETIALADGVALIVPAGAEHNVTNTSTTEDLKLYTIYSPPQHPDGTIHATKAEADVYEASHHHD